VITTTTTKMSMASHDTRDISELLISLTQLVSLKMGKRERERGKVGKERERERLVEYIVNRSKRQD
jgi:hypothetical protein